MIFATFGYRLAVAVFFSLLMCATTAHAQVTVHCTVVLAETGAPLPGATVSIGAPYLSGYYEIAHLIAGADGTYDWTGGCNVFNPPYSFCRVKASAMGFADSVAYFDPTTAQSFLLNLSMHVAASINGHVRYAADGSPAAGIYVQLTCIQSDAPICEHGITAAHVFSTARSNAFMAIRIPQRSNRRRLI